MHSKSLQSDVTGGIVSGASPAYNAEEMIYALKAANARFLMTIPTSMDVAAAAARNAGIPKEQIFLLQGSIGGCATIEQLLDIGHSYGIDGQVSSVKVPDGNSGKDLCLSPTAFCVMISHRNVIAQSSWIQQITTSDHGKVLGVLRFFYITALNHVLHLPALLNAEVYILPAFTMKGMLDAVVKYKIKEILVVPPILIRLIIHLFQKKFPQTKFKQGYGMTESSACITAPGTRIPCTEAKIIDLDGKELGVKEPGEVLVRAIASCTSGQEFIDEDGLLTITDRIKDMIKVKGIGVAPAELEDLLLGHPRTEDTAVVGLHDGYSGERSKAHVLPKTGVKTVEALGRDLIQYVKDRKAKHKWIIEVEFVGVIPKSARGKILRQVLRDQSKETSEEKVVKDLKARRKPNYSQGLKNMLDGYRSDTFT
ncbi:MAG: hypothetical protein Q9216_000165 [Gyalolechia sp. 2 TL-2023]